MDITIVVPVYNRKGLVQKTLDSIPDTFNVIIVDNGSTDGSYEFCKRWLVNSRRKNVCVVNELKPGAAAARNHGLALCKSKWVYFFDSDDEFTGIPDCWDEEMHMVCFPTAKIVNGKEKVRAYMPDGTVHTQILSSMLNTISVIYDAKWLRSIGGWNEECRVWDDWELGVRALINKPKLQWITDKAYHRVLMHDESITGASFSARYKEQLKTMGVVFNEIYTMKDGAEKRNAFYAHFLRCYILSGELLKEKNQAASDEVEEFIYAHYRTNRQSHLFGRLIRWYVNKGGRGAWLFSLKFLQLMKSA